MVRIAVIAPTEGPYAILGGSFVRAVQEAKSELKETRYRYELVCHPGWDFGHRLAEGMANRLV